MKGASLIAKKPDLFPQLVRYLRTLKYSSIGGDFNAIRVAAESGDYFTLYDRNDKQSVFDRYEIPQDAIEQGYRFGYMVECRSETLFCDLLKSAPEELGFIVSDGDGVLFATHELNPDTLSL